MIEIGPTIGNNLNSIYNVLNPLIVRGSRLFLVLTVILAIIMILVRGKRWAEFAIHRKRSSRVILFLLTLVLAIFLPVVGGWSFRYIPVKLEFESPNLTATAIKVGLYGIYFTHEESQLLPEKILLVNCVDVLSWIEAQEHQKSCSHNIDCIEHIPPLTREDILSKIKQSQSTKIDKVSDACKDVDVAKLPPI